MPKTKRAFYYLTIAVLCAAGAQLVLTPPAAWRFGTITNTCFLLAAIIDLLAIAMAFMGTRYGLKNSTSHQATTHPEVSERYNPASKITLRVRSMRSRSALPLRLAPWRRGLIAGTVGLLLVQYALFWLQGETVFLRWVWLATILLAILSCWHPHRPTWQQEQGVEILLLLAVLFLGWFSRSWRLTILPLDFHGDMASMGLTAREMLHAGDWALFRTRWANLPTFAFLPVAFGLHFISDSLFGLRLPSVIEGTAALLFFYLLSRRLFDRWTALLATLWLAGNVAQIHFSRIASYIDPLPWLILAMWALWHGWKHRSAAGWLLAGIGFGFASVSYYSGRAGWVIAALFLLYLLLWQHKSLAGQWSGVALLVLGALLAWGPLPLYFGQHWPAMVTRTREVSLFHPAVMTHLQGKYHIQGFFPLLLEQAKHTFFVFQYFPDSSTQFGFRYPLLNELLVPWLFVGIGALLARWRRPSAALVLIWLVTIWFFGAFMTNNPPFWPRLVLLVPAALLVAAAGLMAWGQSWWGAISRSGCHYRWLIQAGAILLLLVISTAAMRSNWLRYRQYGDHFVHEQAWLGRYLAAQPVEPPVCLVRTPYSLNEREIAFLVDGRKDEEIGAVPVPPEVCRQPGQQSIFYANERLLLAQWEQAVAGSRVAAVYDPAGQFTFWLWRMPKK